ncbi:probable leucine-rich repeat receptor-like protein kinase At1g35710 [Hordeum vulgare subsp. vulgare]|uniref:probable leucine-rich repeat receptor-like protein kinase At1g35710 n=1 Tax=Hordeum vulgare subsp. vulgare TaxID=112509 RepID=UPI001D1A38D6|nr:probable leucine-rich repeat receptor-like protein kinase At1g35710 [Hordeum vulgare subsp. vulgare]
MSLLLALELLLFLLALPCLSSASNSTHSSLDRQAEALLQWKSNLFYYPIDLLDSWTKGSSPCNWTGVDCSKAVPRDRDHGDAALAVSNISLGLTSGSFQHRIIGSIGSIGNLASLEFLYLSNNRITGSIGSIGNLTSLESIDLSNNQFNGLLPPELGSPVHLVYLDLRSNQILGNIPPQIGHCRSLSALRLRNNLLTGQIPQELGYLANLYELDLNKNNLSGAIPVTFSVLYQLFRLNLSYKSLAGRGPSITATLISLDHNIDLCGDSYVLSPCKTPKLDLEHQSRKHPRMALLAFFAPFSLACLSIATITVVCRRKKCVKSMGQRKSGDILSIWNFDGKIAFEDIVGATENFDEKYCIGVGGYGSVFRVQLEGGIKFAVKLLHSMEEYNDDGTFHAEIEVLTKIRHRCIYSASALERETVACRLEDQETRLDPRKTQNPKVDFRVSGQPAQSATV